MHKILSESENPITGSKAAVLCVLDEMNITPDFIVLADDFLRKAFSPAGRIRKKYEQEILNAAGFLGNGPLIARSSAENEDSADRSYAGLFISKKCCRENMLSAVKEVWDSRNNKNAEEYGRMLDVRNSAGHSRKEAASFSENASKKNKIKMGVIIQKYIKGDFGAVAFTGAENGCRWIYLEYAEGGTEDIAGGSCNPYTTLQFLSEYDSLFFSSAGAVRNNHIKRLGMDYETSIRFMGMMFTVAAQILKNNFADFEVICVNSRIYMVQARPVTAGIDPFARNYCLFYDSSGNGTTRAEAAAETFTNRFSRILNIPAAQIQNNGDSLNIDGHWLKQICFFKPSGTVKQQKGIVSELEKLLNDTYISALKILSGSVAGNIEKHIILRASFIQFISFISAYAANYHMAEIMHRTGTEKFHKIFEPFLLFCNNKNNFAIRRGIPPADVIKATGGKAELLYAWTILKTKTEHVKSVVTGLLAKKTSLKNAKDKINVNSPWRQISSGPEAHAAMAEETGNRRNYLLKHGGTLMIKGITVSEGSVQGKAYIVKNCHEPVSHIAENTILILDHVHYNTYTPEMLRNAAGIAVRDGGLCSHTAIIARELGIPCIAGCIDITQCFKSGDEVKIENGSITLIKPAG